jgi:hypothetical protein
MPNQVGTIVPAKAGLFRKAVRVTRSDMPEGFRVFTHERTLQPIVQSAKTELWWTISWPELVALATAAGVNQTGQMEAPAVEERALPAAPAGSPAEARLSSLLLDLREVMDHLEDDRIITAKELLAAAIERAQHPYHETSHQ